MAYGRISAAGCDFVAESEHKGIFSSGSRASQMEGMPTFGALMELWSRRIERLAREFADGRAAVDPTLHACRSCHLHGLCRVPSALDIAAVLGEGENGA